MGKKVLMIFSVFFGLFSVAAFAAVESVKVSGDITTYAVSRSDFNLGSQIPAAPFIADRDRVPADTVSVLASVARLKFDADLIEDVSARVMLVDERIWGKQSDDIYAEEAYFTLKNFLKIPLTIKVGKQPVHLGNDVILGDFDGPTNLAASAGSAFHAGWIDDLSPRKNPEGIVAEYDFSQVAPLKLTSGYLKINESGSATRDDTNIYFANLGLIIQNYPVFELYYIARDTEHKTEKDHVENFGGKLTIKPIDPLILAFEAVFQSQHQSPLVDPFGDPDPKSETAWLACAYAQYSFSNLPWKPALSVDFSIATDKWDTMDENVSVASISNAILYDTNGMVMGATLTARPMSDLGVKLRYANIQLWRPAKVNFSEYAYYVMTNNKHIGNEVDASALYDYTEDVQLGVEADWFLPGKAYDESNREAARQVLGTMKVSF